MHETNTRKRTVLISIALIICLSLASFSLVGCFDQAGGSSNSQGQSSSAKKGLPATLKAYGNTYTIEDFTISENESGNTVVSCKTSGFSKLPMKNNKLVVPVHCAIISSSGGETAYSSFSTKADTTSFTFNKHLTPTKVVFYPADAKSNRVEIPV